MGISAEGPSPPEKILLLGDKSFIKEEKMARIYPNGELFSHVLGQIDDSNNGISGLEKTFDYELTTSKKPINIHIFHQSAASLGRSGARLGGRAGDI